MDDSTPTIKSSAPLQWYIWAAWVLVIIRLWIQPMSSSFWLDETGTFVLVQGTFSEMLEKCARWVGQPTFFIAIVWPFAQLPGPREVILRLPSFLGLAVATVLVYRIGKRLPGSESAGTAALIFATIASYYACDARPYALGLMAASGAILMLIRWLDKGKFIDAIGYACFAALTVYFHFLFSVMFFVQAVYIGLRFWRDRRPSPATLITAIALILALLLPLARRFVQVMSARGSFNFIRKPRLASIVLDTFPEFLYAFLVFGFLLVILLCSEVKFSRPRIIQPEVWMLLLWALVPPVALYVISYVSPTSLLLPRYFSVALPGLALSVAWVFSSFGPAPVRVILVLTLVAGAILDRGGSLRNVRHANDYWREAMAVVKQQTDAASMPVLVRSDFIESADPAIFTDPGQADFLLAPQIAYPGGGVTIPIPIHAEAWSFQRLDSIVDQVLLKGDRFLLVGSKLDEGYQNWLKGRLHSEGFAGRPLGKFGTVVVFLFERK